MSTRRRLAVSLTRLGVLVRRGFAVGAAMLGIALMPACAPSGGLDVAALEAELRVSLLPDYPGAITQAECPQTLDPLEGDVVDCIAFVGDQQAGVRLTFGAERGVYSAAVLNRLIEASQLERLIATQFANDLQLTTTVVCPQPVVVLGADGDARCVAIDHVGVERALIVAVGPDGVVDVDLA